MLAPLPRAARPPAAAMIDRSSLCGATGMYGAGVCCCVDVDGCCVGGT